VLTDLNGVILGIQLDHFSIWSLLEPETTDHCQEPQPEAYRIPLALKTSMSHLERRLVWTPGCVGFLGNLDAVLKPEPVLGFPGNEHLPAIQTSIKKP